MVELGNFKATMKIWLVPISEWKTHGCAQSFVQCGRYRLSRASRFLVGTDSGFVLPVHSKIGKEMRKHIEWLVQWYGRKQLIPVCIEDNIFNFYLSKEVRSNETNIVNHSQQLGNEYGALFRMFPCFDCIR